MRIQTKLILIKNINFDISIGEKIGIKGKTGSGKVLFKFIYGHIKTLKR